MSTPRLDLTGRTFGRLVVLSLHSVKHGTRWLCRCECGSEKVIDGSKLKRGLTQSCGCFMRERQKALRPATKHGHSKASGESGTYRSWYSMLQRCTNPNNGNFRFYGALGVTVCERWKTFGNFLADMGARPDGTSIDRVDNTRGYEPDNCRWATQQEQRANQRNGAFRGPRRKRQVSLGPANDDSDAVRVEVRAAAQSLVPAGTYCNADIWSGYFCAMNDLDPPPWPHCPDAWAGWLAHEITEHEDGPRHLAGYLARCIAEHPTGADQ